MSMRSEVVRSLRKPRWRMRVLNAETGLVEVHWRFELNGVRYSIAARATSIQEATDDVYQQIEALYDEHYATRNP